MLNQQEYFRRIGYSGDQTPSLETLKKLQKTHILHIPFENLDIHYGIPINLNLNRIYQKVILHKRGGFCYELNGLFYHLLTEMGFKTRRISCRVYDEKKGYGPAYDHLATIVLLDSKEYLADVGFGEFCFEPLTLDLNISQDDERGHFFIDKLDEDYLRVSKMVDGKFKPEYIFQNIHREYKEYSAMCHYHQTHPDSHFTQKKFITIARKNGGRITLSQNNLKFTSGDIIEERPIKNDQEFEKALHQYFGITL